MVSIETVSVLFAVFLLLFGYNQATQYEEEWVAREEFSGMLPSSILPMFERSDILTTGECFMYCAMKNCSSLAYSETYRSCKLYYHPHLANPLPPLQADVDQQHQMYYKRWYCPQGWIVDREIQQCYYLGTTEGSMYRRDAWSVCEERMMSNLVTFQTPKQRDNLYKLLDENAPSVFKWWTGYGMFDSNLWMRTVEEFPGYIRRRGGCPGNDIISCQVMTISQCWSECERKYRDRCVAFLHSRSDGKCCLKRHSCENPTRPLADEAWLYEKVHPSRPASLLKGGQCYGNDVKMYPDVTRDQCINYCRSMPQCIEVAYKPAERNCWAKFKSCVEPTRDYSLGAAVESYIFRDVNVDSPCPYGVRYRDVCLNFWRTTGSYQTMADNCRKMGGKIPYPIEARKVQYIYAAQVFYGQGWAADYVDIGHEGNYTSFDNVMQFEDPFFERWPWQSSAGEPNGGPSQNCARPAAAWSNAAGNGNQLLDATCSNLMIGICETPISMSWPKDCRFTTAGREYAGSESKTISGINCKPWSSTPQAGKWQKFPEWHDSHSFCRNPDPAIFADSVWCYRSDNNQSERCQVPMCPESDWSNQQDFADPWKPYATLANSVAAADHYDWAVEGYKAVANPLCSLDMKAWCPYYYKGSCYMFYSIPMSHDDAALSCSKNGWYLATITSVDEQNFIIGQTQSLSKLYFNHPYGYHMGLRTAANGTWYWENGEPLLATYWTPGQPNNALPACGGIYIQLNGYWEDYTCWFKKFYICELAIGR